MRYIVFLLFFCFSVPACLAKGGFWRSFYGNAPDNAVNIGAFVLHFSGSSDYHYFYPMFGVTYHSFNAMYFNNSFEKPTVGLALERNWISHQLTTNLAFNLNYRLGALFGGYCLTSLKCNRSPRIRAVPVMQVIAGLSYKKHAAITVSWLGFVLTGGLQYRF